MSDVPFSFSIRRDNPYEPVVTARFEVADGTGFIGLRVPGRTDPEPAIAGEEDQVSADVLRAGRFVHVVGGNRQSYALSRMTQQAVDALPDGRWVVLDAVTEYGFRYLQLPADLAGHSMPPHQLEPVMNERLDAAAAQLRTPGAATRSTRPQTKRTPAGASTEQQVPVAPALAQSALESLSHGKAKEYLLAEMAKVDALHHQVAALERELSASKAREADLLEVLKRWQSR